MWKEFFLEHGLHLGRGGGERKVLGLAAPNQMHEKMKRRYQTIMQIFSCGESIPTFFLRLTTPKPIRESTDMHLLYHYVLGCWLCIERYTWNKKEGASNYCRQLLGTSLFSFTCRRFHPTTCYKTFPLCKGVLRKRRRTYWSLVQSVGKNYWELPHWECLNPTNRA